MPLPAATSTTAPTHVPAAAATAVSLFLLLLHFRPPADTTTTATTAATTLPLLTAHDLLASLLRLQYRYITVLREPLERAVSLFYWHHHEAKMPRDFPAGLDFAQETPPYSPLHLACLRAYASGNASAIAQLPMSAYAKAKYSRNHRGMWKFLAEEDLGRPSPKGGPSRSSSSNMTAGVAAGAALEKFGFVVGLTDNMDEFMVRARLPLPPRRHYHELTRSPRPL